MTRNGTEVARYQYDALGRRVEKMIGTERTTHLYDGEGILKETAGTASGHYVHGPGIDEPLARVAGGTVTYFHADGLGSIVGHTNSAGALVYSRSYDAFGNLETGASEPGYAFTGREWDPETGLYYYRARYYDAKIGRFISEDPIGFYGGDVHLYSYIFNIGAPSFDWILSSGYIYRANGPAPDSDAITAAITSSDPIPSLCVDPEVVATALRWVNRAIRSDTLMDRVIVWNALSMSGKFDEERFVSEFADDIASWLAICMTATEVGGRVGLRVDAASPDTAGAS